MHALTLDFRHNDRPFGWINSLLLLTGLALLSLTAYYAWQMSERTSELESFVASRSKPAAKSSASRNSGEQQEMEREMGVARNVVTQLNLPWEPMFKVLEDAPQKVALLSVEPDARKRELVLTGEAKDFTEMLDYVRYLQGQPMFFGINLQTHQINQQDNDKPVRFRLTAGWAAQ